MTFSVDRLERDASDEDSVQELQAKAQTLVKGAEDRTQDLEDLLTNMVEFDSRAAELFNWLADSIKILKPKGGAPRPTRAKVFIVSLML